MTKGQENEPPDKDRQQKQSMSFPLEAFLKKLKKEQREKARGADKE